VRFAWQTHVRTRSRVTVLCLLIAVVGTAAAPARAADEPGSSNYSTKLREIQPPVSGLDLTVDEPRSLVLENRTRKPVVVQGYDRDPYLRFKPNGVVEVNVNSSAKFLNEDPTGNSVAPPPSFRPGAAPKWRQVATNGTYKWFDHRIHWTGTRPPGVKDPDKRARIFDWAIPIAVGGQRVRALGTLSWVPDSSGSGGTSWGLVIAIAAAVLLVAAAAAALLRRRRRAPASARREGTKEAW
jgi:MYXO-CTERM domain-containing protein